MKNIYLARQSGTFLYKIGLTKKDPEVRIRELQTGNANEIQLVESFRTEFDWKTETAMHAHFRSKNVSGEWFELTDDEVKSFYSLCERAENSFNILKENTYLRRHEF